MPTIVASITIRAARSSTRRRLPAAKGFFNMADGTAESDTFIGSHEKALNGYGQNGFQGPASDLPGQHTTSGFLPQCELPKIDDNWQTRKVKSDAYAPAFGMSAKAAPVTIPTANSRPVKRK